MVEKEKENRRSFFGPDEDKVFFIEPPTAEDIRGADWQYSKTFTQCLIEGITTSAEMMDILTRRGIIGPEFEQRVVELSRKLGELISRLEDTSDIDEKRELAISVSKAREELFQWNQRLNGPMNNTAEQISDDARLEFLTSSMIVDEDGNRVWDSYDTYLKEKSQSLALRARFEVMLFLQGLASDFLDQTPEARAMRIVEKDVLSKAEEVLMASEAVKQEEDDKIESFIDESIASLPEVAQVDDIEEKSVETKKKSSKKTKDK